MTTGRGWRGRDAMHEQIPSLSRPPRWEVVCLGCGEALGRYARQIKLTHAFEPTKGRKTKILPRLFECMTCEEQKWPQLEDGSRPADISESQCYILRRIGVATARSPCTAFENTIIEGDVVQVMRQIPPASVHLTVTSPPYGSLRKYKGHGFDCKATIAELYRVARNGGIVCWVVGDETVKGSKNADPYRQVIAFLDAGFRLHDTIIYCKSGWAFPHEARYYPVFEHAFVFSKGKPAVFNPICDRPNKHAGSTRTKVYERRQSGVVKTRAKDLVIGDFGRRTNVWEYSPGYGKSTRDKEAYEHPAIMPEALAQDLILSFSNPGQLVLDPFAGSGTTCKMARLNGRRYVGIDIAPEYCKIARTRLELVN